MMEVLRDDNELVFLYQLVKGHSNNSLACHIASIAGLPQELVDRGNEVSFNNQLASQLLQLQVSSYISSWTLIATMHGCIMMLFDLL